MPAEYQAMFSWMAKEAICSKCGITNKIKLDGEIPRAVIVKTSNCICGGELI